MTTMSTFAAIADYPPAMNRKEAAKFLGIGVRTLDRYAKQARISGRLEKGKTRPIVIYETADLFRLRAELKREGRTTNRATTIGENDHIGFRLDHYYLVRLEEEARKRDVSPGQYARQLVISGLEMSAYHSLSEEAHTLKAQLTRHRAEFSQAVETLLELLIRVVGADEVTPEEARKEAIGWVEEHLGRG